MFCLFAIAGDWKTKHTKEAFFTRLYGLAVSAGEVFA